jgi:AcrR family transcriptional regulator
LLYHYFPTKRDLYVAGLREIANELVEAVVSVPDNLTPIDGVRAGLDAFLEHITRHSRAYVSLMRGGIGSDPEVAAVVESVRGRLFETFLEGSPFAPLPVGNPRLEMGVRGWIGFVEGATIDWCAKPRLTRTELRDLLTESLFAIVRLVAPSIFQPAPP